MNWHRAATAIICLGFALTLARADGMPEPEDENYNPVPSVPGAPAPGVTQPKPIKQPKPNVAPEPTPSPDESGAPDEPPPPAPKPAPAPAAPPPPSAPAPTPAPAPAPTPAPSPAPVTEAPPATPAPTQTAQKKPVYDIQSVDVQLAERQPPFVTVTVKGTTRTGGWKDLELRPLPTLVKEVGMRSYTLVATPPSGVATQALTPVTATITIDPLPSDVKTIRVLGETNEVAQTFR